MRILYIINNLGSGGAEKLIEDSLPILNEIEDVEVDLLLLTDKGNVFVNALVKRGISINVIPIKRPKSPFNIYYIRKQIVTGKYDVVHAHLFPAIYWVSLTAKLIGQKRPKFFYTEHSTHNKRREKKLLRYLEKSVSYTHLRRRRCFVPVT